MQRMVRICYRKIIDSAATKPWEKLVWQDSYTEFNMQAQRYNNAGAIAGFSDMLHSNPQAAQLHFLVSSAVTGYIQQLHQVIPDIQNTLGKQFLPLDNFRFELIQSNTGQPSKHVVAINFFSAPILWIDTIGNTLLLSANQYNEAGEMLTHLLQLQPFVSICSIQQQ
jgi:hypothetical protein